MDYVYIIFVVFTSILAILLTLGIEFVVYKALLLIEKKEIDNYMRLIGYTRHKNVYKKILFGKTVKKINRKTLLNTLDYDIKKVKYAHEKGAF